MKCEVVAIICLNNWPPVQKVVIVNDTSSKVTLAQYWDVLLVVIIHNLMINNTTITGLREDIVAHK